MIDYFWLFFCSRFFSAKAIVENGFVLFDHRVLRGKSDIMLMICYHGDTFTVLLISLY